jgi:hypothetical protein
MSNRTGKREREAGIRKKRRGYTSGRTRTGAVLRPLKLGRRKRDSFRNRPDIGLSFVGGPLWTHVLREDTAALPVADAERRGVSAKES